MRGRVECGRGPEDPCNSSRGWMRPSSTSRRANAPTHIGVVCDLRPEHRAGRRGHLQGDPREHRAAPAPLALLPAEARHGSAGSRPPVLDRGPRLRSRVPRPPHRAAQARRLAPALHPGRADPLAAARSRASAVGDVRDRGPRQRRGRAAGLLRGADEDPPRGDRRRRRRRDDRRDPRHVARCRAAAAGAALGRPSAVPSSLDLLARTDAQQHPQSVPPGAGAGRTVRVS